MIRLKNGDVEFKHREDFDNEDDFVLYTMAMMICGTNILITEEIAFTAVIDALDDEGSLTPITAYEAGQMAVYLAAEDQKKKGKTH